MRIRIRIEVKSRIRIRIKVKSWIRIRFHVMRIQTLKYRFPETVALNWLYVPETDSTSRATTEFAAAALQNEQHSFRKYM